MRKIKGLFAYLVQRRFRGYKHQVAVIQSELPTHLKGERSVAVVGAGIAGLAAAALLAERGFRVTLFERESYLGGKVGSWPVTLGKGFHTCVEHGFHAFFRQYYNLRRLLDKFKVTHFLIPIDDYLISTLDLGNFGFKNINTTPLLNMLSMARHKVYRMRDMIRNPNSKHLLALLRYDAHKTFDKFDDLSFNDFADLVRLPKQLRIIFNTFSRAFFAEAHLMSMAEMIKSFHFYFLSHDLGLIYDVMNDDFSNTLLEPARKYLQELGVDIRTSNPVTSIRRKDGKFLIGGKKYDYTIMAVDVKAMKRIAQASTFIKRENSRLYLRLSHLKASQKYAVLRLWLDRSIKKDVPFYIFTDRIKILDSISLYHKFEASSAAWVRKTGGAVIELHSYALPDNFEGEQKVKNQLIEELKSYYPDLRGARIIYDYLQLRDDFTAFHTGLYRDRPCFRTGIPRFYLAADWVKTPYPAMLMEAACTSAFLAANCILEEENLRQEPLFTVPTRGLLAKRA